MKPVIKFLSEHIIKQLENINGDVKNLIVSYSHCNTYNEFIESIKSGDVNDIDWVLSEFPRIVGKDLFPEPIETITGDDRMDFIYDIQGRFIQANWRSSWETIDFEFVERTEIYVPKLIWKPI